jgi:hypothetical protein
MAKKIIELHNGRIKRTGNRIGGDTSSIETRYRRRDNESKLNLIRRQHNLDARQAIEDCDMIGPRGVINKSSSDYAAPEPRRNQSQRRNSRRRNNNNNNNNQGYAQHFVAPNTMVTTVVKPKRPPIKVIIDEGGTMRAIPVV